MTLIKNFKGISKSNTSIAGGKGASLGEMTQAGIPVPPGFVVLSDVFEQFLKESGLDVEIDAALDTVNHKEIHTVENASERIQAKIMEEEIPKNIANAVMDSFKKLGAKWVAVRSSATAEDSASAAWAGQLDSFLNTSEKNLLTNVKRCWASLFTPRAIFYRFEKDLHKQKISVAVIVQKMVESEVSGIAFSVHPVTQDYNQLIIEAGYGLGEAIVSGQITPDSYVVTKKEKTIIEARTERQVRRLNKKPDGGNGWIMVPSDKQEAQKLTNKQILELSDLIIRIENHYSFPCDIEWAFEKGKFYITQSRPITTLASKTESTTTVLDKKNDGDQWSKLLAREGVDVTTISGIDVVFYDLIRQWKKTKSELFFTHLKGKHFTHFIGVNSKEMGRFVYNKYFKNPDQIKKYYLQGKALLNEIKKNVKKWTNTLIKKSDKKTLLSAFKAFRSDFEVVNRIYSIYSWVGIEAWQADFEVLLNSLIRKNGLEKQTEKIISSAYKPWKKTALIEMQEKLTAGARPEALAKDYQFLRSWSVVWNKPITPKWVQGIKNTAPEKGGPWYTYKELVALLKPCRAEKDFLTIAPYIVFFKDWRDDLRRAHAYHWSFLFERLALKWELSYDDVGYLSLDEIEKALKTEKIPVDKIQRRKEDGCIITISSEKWAIEVLDHNVPEKYKAIIASVEKEGKNEIVTGTIAQKGFVRGPVKIVRSFHDIKKVYEGDVLVANTTHPNFMPAMKKAAAFVTNEGGMISHAAIVAREMKKPCIVGSKNATQVLKDGDLVEVDADKGVVKILGNLPQ